MKWTVSEIDSDVRIFPTEGRARVTLISVEGKRKEIDLPLTKIDKFAQVLMNISETGRTLGKNQNHVWELKLEDIICDLLPVKDFRLLPFRETGELGIQFRIEGKGLAGVKLSDQTARQLIDRAPDQLNDYKVTRNGDKFEVSVAAATYLDKSRAQSPSAPLAIPDRFCAPIGRIVATWGQFEAQFIDFLEAMIEQNRTDTKTRRNFSKPVKRFRVEMKLCFAPLPGLLDYLESILTDATDLQWQRNVIAHGVYSSLVHVKRAANSPFVFVDVKMEATGTRKGKPVTLTLDKEGLENLYYKIAHLAGRMQSVAILGHSKTFEPPHERSALQDFLRANQHKFHLHTHTIP